MLRPRVHDICGRNVLVTGAASGIGRATALALAAEGAELHLTDRDGDGLADTVDRVTAVGGTVAVHATADVADHGQVVELAAAVHRRVPALDVVMNVAGVSAWGTVDRMAHGQWRAMVDVNLLGPIHVVEAFLPPMMAAGRGGYLVNVSSAAGLLGLPWHAAYSASKYGVRGLSDVLRFDLRRHGIGVSLVCPGAVATPLADTIEVAGVDTSTPEFRRLKRLFLRRAVPPERAAAVIVDAVHRGRYLVFTSADIRLLFAAQRHAPHLYALGMDAANRAFHRAFARLPA